MALASIDDSPGTLGFDAATILEFALGVHETTVRFTDRPVDEFGGDLASTDGPLQVSPVLGREPLSIELQYTDGEVRYFPPGPGSQSGCKGRLEVDVELRLRSESGALEDHWSAVLSATSPAAAVVAVGVPTEVNDAQGPGLEATDAALGNRLEGTLEVVDGDDSRSSFAWLDLWLEVSELGVNGWLSGWVRTRGDRVSLVQNFGEIGVHCVWGPGYRVDPETALGGLPPPAELIAAMESVGEASGRWADGTLAVLSVGFEYQEGSACARPQWVHFDGTPPGEVLLGGTLALADADGRIEASWPVELEARNLFFEGSREVRVGFSRLADPSSSLSLTADELRDRWGVLMPTGAELERFAQLELRFEAELVATATGHGLEGEVTVTGYGPHMPPEGFDEMAPTCATCGASEQLLQLTLGVAADAGP